MEVIGHETIAEEAEGIAVLGLGEGFEEGDTVAVITEDVGAVVAAVEGVIDEPIIEVRGRRPMPWRIATRGRPSRKMN